MSDELTKLTQAEQTLQLATDPEQSKVVESLSAAAIAWAKEQGDYELAIAAARVYILARRKTTELIKPNIGGFQGNQYVVGNIDVTHLEDFGFTKMQWNRRTKELRVTESDLNDYIDKCIESGISIPTVGGLLAATAKRLDANREPEGRFLTPHQQAKELAMGMICGAIRERDRAWLLSDDCIDYFEELQIPYDFVRDWVTMGFLPADELIVRILYKRLEEDK
jgi:hypothetical protein